MVDYRRSERPQQPAANTGIVFDPEDAVMTGELSSPPIPPFRSQRSILADEVVGHDSESDPPQEESDRRVAAYVAPAGGPTFAARVTAWFGSVRLGASSLSIAGKVLAVAVAAVLMISLGRAMSASNRAEHPAGEASSAAPLGPETGGSGFNSGSESGRGGSNGAARTTGQIVDGSEETSPGVSRTATLDSDLLVGSSADRDAVETTDATGRDGESDLTSGNTSTAGSAPDSDPTPSSTGNPLTTSTTQPGSSSSNPATTATTVTDGDGTTTTSTTEANSTTSSTLIVRPRPRPSTTLVVVPTIPERPRPTGPRPPVETRPKPHPPTTKKKPPSEPRPTTPKRSTTQVEPDTSSTRPSATRPGRPKPPPGRDKGESTTSTAKDATNNKQPKDDKSKPPKKGKSGDNKGPKQDPGNSGGNKKAKDKDKPGKTGEPGDASKGNGKGKGRPA